jgi:nickel-dependent lactate racemase
MSTLYYANGSETAALGADTLQEGLYRALDTIGPRKKVLLLPPDYTRFHSRAGELTRYAWSYYGDRCTDILPALGTHVPLSENEITDMFGDVPRGLFRVHDWRNAVTTLGEVPGEYVAEVSEGVVDYPWPAQVADTVAAGGHDLIISIGQVVPHEVAGMANFNKNVFVGTGGAEGIHKSHFLGAAYGMERIMGRADNPVRRVLNYASAHFATNLPILYVLTVIGRSSGGELETRGLFIGDGMECFQQASALSRMVNFDMLDPAPQKIVVYLEPGEFKSAWLGNKAIYRTRMAIEDGGEVLIVAPGVQRFGEDDTIDRLIRRYGYVGTPKTLGYVGTEPELASNLSAAAHLIHGSSEGRFRITYCPGGLSREEVESVGFGYGDCGAMLERYTPEKMHDGINVMPDGEEIFYISNPALGLWANKKRFTGE